MSCEELTRARRLTDEEGQRLQALVRRGKHDSIREPKAFAWTDYRDLVQDAHRRLERPVVLVWDNLNRHTCAEMTAFAAENERWLTVIRLPAHAPELNPVESVWSLLERGELANHLFTDVDHLAGLVRRGLGRIQRHPHLLDGTGLTLKPP